MGRAGSQELQIEHPLCSHFTNMTRFPGIAAAHSKNSADTKESGSSRSLQLFFKYHAYFFSREHFAAFVIQLTGHVFALKRHFEKMMTKQNHICTVITDCALKSYFFKSAGYGIS